MIKSDLIKKLAEDNPHLYYRDVEKIVGTIFDEIIIALENGNRVELRGFGAFSTKNIAPQLQPKIEKPEEQEIQRPVLM